ncbi:hypothetical protein ACFSQ3_08640 [Sphingobacterium corticis]|uniref:Uncharacterized protein n=1 Tax=Sphingobacterium corticis TaxID=1812823 RepID=A0ABW5NIT2_9SPHI
MLIINKSNKFFTNSENKKFELFMSAFTFNCENRSNVGILPVYIRSLDNTNTQREVVCGRVEDGKISIKTERRNAFDNCPLSELIYQWIVEVSKETK